MKKQEQMQMEAEILAQDYDEEQLNLGPFTILNSNDYRSPEFENCCNWTFSQNAKYAAFLMTYDLLLRNKAPGKLWCVFKTMAKFLKTRNYRQCKLHHQRMCVRFSTFEEILKNLHLSSENFQHHVSCQLTALKQFTEKIIRQKRQLARKRNSQVEDPEQIDLESKKEKKPKKTSENYSLIVTLDIRPEKQVYLSDAQGMIACEQLFKKWKKLLSS